MFENSRWFFIAVVAAIIGIGYAASYLSSVDSANAMYEEAKTKLASLEEIATQRQKAVLELQNSATQIREQQEKGAVLLKAKEVLDARVRKIEGEFRDMTATIKVAVERARNEAPGKEVGDLTLANGKTLRSVKFRKLDESGASLSHADGIGSVPLDQLPAEMLEKYDYISSPLLAALTDGEKAFAESGNPASKDDKKKPAVTTVARTAPSSPPTEEPKVDEAKLKALRLKIASVESSIATAQSTAASYQQQASDQYTNGDIAKARGTPATRYWAAAQQAAQQAQVYKAQVESLKAEKRKLEIELEFASARK
ncbi:MAG: hypothetical protein IAE77_21795 [Prosthecobacter sp.]|jgi:hypothetical protein|uniref:hypothetical protein n=1 Tax=Prosthecobacter sp. TaxID=1965333 RepID=UPI001A05F6BD|nr:hypothetical protein [Prosthecobacter sp.]MBE2286104.1 hypothetical protein [Prosthecobacter sp.]